MARRVVHRRAPWMGGGKLGGGTRQACTRTSREVEIEGEGGGGNARNTAALIEPAGHKADAALRPAPGLRDYAARAR